MKFCSKIQENKTKADFRKVDGIGYYDDNCPVKNTFPLKPSPFSTKCFYISSEFYSIA